MHRPGKLSEMATLTASSSSSSLDDDDDDDDEPAKQTTRSSLPLQRKSPPPAPPRSSLSSYSDALLLPDEPRFQARVLLWAVPRSISTAFFRAIMEGARIKVLLEPFSNAYYFGEERVSRRYADRAPLSNSRFSDITSLYEAPYSRYKSVFAKDMAYYIPTGDSSAELSRLLPRGYCHTFLIRHPRQSVSSLYRLSIDKQRTGWDWFNPDEAGFRELFQLFQYVTHRLGQQAIVVDADDLIKNPRQTLIKYCSLTGLEFSDKMLSWKSIDYSLATSPTDESSSDHPEELTGVYFDQQQPQQQQQQQVEGLAEKAQKQLSIPPQIFRGWGPWFEGVLSSTSFRAFSLPAPDHQTATNPPSLSTTPQLPHVASAGSLPTQTASNNKKQEAGTSRAPLPAYVEQCIAECMPYYEHLRKYKI